MSLEMRHCSSRSLSVAALDQRINLVSTMLLRKPRTSLKRQASSRRDVDGALRLALIAVRLEEIKKTWTFRVRLSDQKVLHWPTLQLLFHNRGFFLEVKTCLFYFCWLPSTNLCLVLSANVVDPSCVRYCAKTKVLRYVQFTWRISLWLKV